LEYMTLDLGKRDILEGEEQSVSSK